MTSPRDWMCPACQHINFKKRESCQRCNCSKFANAADVAAFAFNETRELPGDWYCSTTNCGAHNYASRTGCYRCGTFRCDYYGSSLLPGWKTGDWICNRLGCGMHNYANREQCFKCNAPRDYGGAV